MSHVDEGVLHAYLDGELPAAERAAAEGHMAQCADCRARLAEERALVGRAAELLGFAAPRERPAPPFDQVGRRPRRPRSPWHVRMPVAWAASIALALAVGYYMHAPETAIPTTAPQDIAFMQDRAPAETRAEGSQPAAGVRATRRSASRSAPREPAPLPLAPPSTDRARDATIAQQRADTPASLLGEVANRPEANLLRSRQSRPAAAAAPGSVAPRLEESDRNEWPFASRDRARQILGAGPVGVPGLPVRAIRRDPGGDSGVVVEQELDAATVIQVFQRRVGQEDYTRGLERPQSKAARSSNERLARFVGTLRVEIAGPLQPDSLNRLLEQVQTLP